MIEQMAGTHDDSAALITATELRTLGRTLAQRLGIHDDVDLSTGGQTRSEPWGIRFVLGRGSEGEAFVDFVASGPQPDSIFGRADTSGDVEGYAWFSDVFSYDPNVETRESAAARLRASNEQIGQELERRGLA